MREETYRDTRYKRYGTQRIFSALVVRHWDGRLFRTRFRFTPDRDAQLMDELVTWARYYGYEPIARVRCSYKVAPLRDKGALTRIA